MAVAAYAVADTVKGKGSINKPLIVAWLGEGPTQITVTWKKTSTTPLLIVIGNETDDLLWCASAGHDSKSRMMRCDFNALFDFYALAVGATSGSDTFELTMTSDPIEESRAQGRQASRSLTARAEEAIQRLAVFAARAETAKFQQ